MRRGQPVEAVFLDAGGVFTLPAAATAGAFLAAHGADGSAAAVERCHYHGMLAYDDEPDEAERRGSAYLEGFLGAAGIGAGRAPAFDAALRSAGWTTIIQASLHALPALAATGVRLAVVSNSDGTVQARLAAAGVLQVGPGGGVPVAAVIDSAAVGVAKPDPRIFDYALDACEVAPEAAVHIGDSRRADVAGALAAGIRPLHLDPYGLCPDPSHEHIRALADVAALLGLGSG